MDAAQGILTTRGGMTSHAAVVARGLGKPCVAGLESATIRYENKTITFRTALLLGRRLADTKQHHR